MDRDSQPWWEAVERGEHVHQRCDGCGRWRWPPRAMCGECGSFDWSWQAVSGRGRVVSHIRTHHSFLPGLEAPYTTVFVALAEQDDIVMPGFWRGPGEPEVGQTVNAQVSEGLIGWA